MVVFTGQHYMILIRVRVDGSKAKIWTLFNDDQPIKRFEKGWSQVTEYMVTSSIVPTMILYENCYLKSLTDKI